MFDLRALVEQVIEYLQSLVGHADLVEVWKDEGAMEFSAFTFPPRHIEFTADIAARFFDVGEQVLMYHDVTGSLRYPVPDRKG